MEWITDPQAWIALVTLTALEIVLGIDNIIFISVLSGRLPGEHPTVKMLAMAFLLLVGLSLVAEGFGQHIPKGYIYFAMGFSVLVEMLNLRARAAGESAPVKLRRRMAPSEARPTQ